MPHNLFFFFFFFLNAPGMHPLTIHVLKHPWFACCSPWPVLLTAPFRIVAHYFAPSPSYTAGIIALEVPASALTPLQTDWVTSQSCQSRIRFMANAHWLRTMTAAIGPSALVSALRQEAKITVGQHSSQMCAAVNIATNLAYYDTSHLQSPTHIKSRL